MTGMSPSRWHFGKCCCCSEGQKHVFLLSQLQKECETEKGRQRRVVTGLTPGGNSDTLLPWELQPWLLAKLSPETNPPRQMSLPTTRWFCLPGKAQVPVEERGWSLHKIKNYFIFQDSVNKKTFQLFSKKPFPFEETLEFELRTRVTPFITWSHRLHASSTGSTAGFYWSPQWLHPPAGILT